MITLAQQLRTTIADGLLRASAGTCSRWAAQYRVIINEETGIEQKLNYNQHPWTLQLRDNDRPWIGPKAAQMGYTEACLDRTFFTIDIKKQSVLYLLPKKSPDASDFSASRFDPALELSPHLRSIFHNVSNVGHKRAGSASLFIRGTRSKSAVKSVPVNLVVFDEKDEMHQANIAQALERMSGKTIKQWIEISTPTIPNFGIDASFITTNQHHFFFTCPSCSRRTELLFPDCLVITADSVNDPELKKSHYICKECKNKLPHESKVDWLTKAMWRKKAGWEKTTNHTSDIDGFYINQFYSFKMTPVEIATVGLKARYSTPVEQEWWNSKGGMTHEVSGARILDSMIANCLGNHHLNSPIPNNNPLITMGVDQGKWIYYEIAAWYFPQGLSPDLNTHAVKYVVAAGRVATFEELDGLMKNYNVQHCVIDANPERREATRFKERFWGRVHLCFYNRGIVGKDITINNDQGTVSVDRTSWLDQTLDRFKKGKDSLILPYDISQEYKEHVKALVRKPGLDSDGNPVAKYINTEADHSAHAANYCEIALPLAASVLSNEHISAFL